VFLFQKKFYVKDDSVNHSGGVIVTGTGWCERDVSRCS
jgi:hypothetical protein